MSIHESEDTGSGVTSPIFGPIRNQLQLSFARSPALSEGQDSAEEGVIAPVLIGHLRRPDHLRSPAISDGQDSDATDEGVIAPVMIGNRQRFPAVSPVLEEEQDSDNGEESSAHINLDTDLRAASVLMSNETVPDNAPWASVIVTRTNFANLETGQSDSSVSLPPAQQDGEEGTEDTVEVILMDSPVIGSHDSEIMEVEVIPNEPSDSIHSLVVVPENEDNVAGSSSHPDGVTPLISGRVPPEEHLLLDEEAIIPVVVNCPVAPLQPDTSGTVNEALHPSQNVQHTSGETAETGSPEAIAVGAASTTRPADQGGIIDDSIPPCKRQRLSSDGSPVVKKEAPIMESDDDDGLTCTICLDQWTSSGEHRLVSLKCGHLFGFSCIERWIKNQKAAERKCPTCKSKAKMADVRNLYGHRIRMIDTTELEELRGKNKELVCEKEELMREWGYLRKQNDELQLKHREALLEIQKLKSEKMVSQRAICRFAFGYRAQLVHTLELSKNEGCRVLAFNEVRSIIAASLPSPTNLFKEYAIKLIDAESFRPRQTMPSHSRMIRDVAFSDDGKLLLSCSLDKTANVLDMDSNTSIATFHSEMPIWSACWDANNPWVLFTGSQNGVVQQYDVRSPGQEVSRIVTDGNPTPVASLAGVPKNSGAGWPHGGLLSCRFRQLYPYERTSTDTFISHPCSIDGAFTSLRYEKRSEHFLVSTRPTEKSPRAQHMLFQMSALGKEPQYNLIQNFFGSSTLGVISRSCIMPVMSPQGEVEDLLVSSYVESESHIGLWSCSGGQKLQSIQSSEIIMDLCPIFANGKNFLSSLSDKKLRLYKIEKVL